VVEHLRGPARDVVRAADAEVGDGRVERRVMRGAR
jgi:hypothetical protein